MSTRIDMAADTDVSVAFNTAMAVTPEDDKATHVKMHCKRNVWG
jgi:hypothetical protein